MPSHVVNLQNSNIMQEAVEPRALIYFIFFNAMAEIARSTLRPLRDVPFMRNAKPHLVTCRE
jgi:hypothetical protein